MARWKDDLHDALLDLSSTQDLPLYVPSALRLVNVKVMLHFREGAELPSEL